MEAVIIIKSDSTHINSIPEQLHDIGKKLAKLMYSTPKPYLNGKSIVVVFPTPFTPDKTITDVFALPMRLKSFSYLSKSIAILSAINFKISW